MLWARVMLAASAALWQDQTSPALERLLELTLRHRGVSPYPLLVVDSASPPGLVTSLLRVLQCPVLLLRTPIPRTVDAAMAAEPVTGTVLILRDEPDFSSTLQSFLDTSLKWSRHWTIRSTLLVILISPDRQRADYQFSLQRTLDRSHVLDASVLVLDAHPQSFQNTTMEATLYSWIRNMSYTNCTRDSGSLTAIGQWNLQGSPIIKFPTAVLPRKLPRTQESCPLTVLAYPYVPLAMLEKSEDGRRHFVGFEVSMVELVAQIHGFPLRLIDGGTMHTLFGKLLDNGTWSGMPGDLASGRADLALGGIPVVISESRPLEFTTSYMREGLLWFTPRPERLPSWYSVFSGKPSEIILTMTALHVVISLIIWISSSTRGVRQYIDFDDSCLAMFAVIFSVPVKEPSILTTRVAFLSWVIFSMVMETTVSSTMTSHLSHPLFARAISNDEELAHSGLRGATLPTIAEFYPTFKKPGAINITKTCESNDDCARRVAYDRDVAVLVPDLCFKYIGKTKFHDEFGVPLFTPLRDRVISSPIAMVLAKGNPLAPVISDTILRIVEAGLPRYDTRPSAGRVVADTANDSGKRVFSFYFALYLATTVSTVVVLLGEITYKKWYHWQKRASRRSRLKIIKNAPIYHRGRSRIGGGLNTPITTTV